MRNLIKPFIVLLILASAIYLYLYTGSSHSTYKTSGKNNAPVPILAAKAVAQDMPVALDLVGRGEAYESVSLKSRVDGQVKDVLFKEGQHVHTGDILLHLDPADFDARLKQAEADRTKDMALLKQAQAEVVRYQALKQQGFVSDEKVNDLIAAAGAAEATVSADNANIDLARLQLSYATIRAPFSGIIGARLVFPGTAIKTNDTVLAVLNRVHPLLVSFALPEEHLAELREELSRGTVKAMVGVPGGNDRYPAVVNFIDNAVDPMTGTLLVKAQLDNTDEQLSAGQYLRVTLILKMLKNAIVVPSQAVQQGPNGTVIYVVNADNSITIRKVDVAASRDGMSAIGSGLNSGEMVVTDGHLRLTPKSKVKINTAVTK